MLTGLLHGVAATHDTGCVSFAPSRVGNPEIPWRGNLVGGPEFRQSPTDYIHFKTGCNSAASEYCGYVEGNVPTTPGVTYVVKVELGVVTISGASDSRSLITTVGQASQTFDASALVSRTDRSLYEWVEAATFTTLNSSSTTLRFEEGDFNCMDMKDVELCPVPKPSLSPLLSLKQQVGLWFRMDEYTDPPGTNAPPASFGSAMMIEDDTMAVGAPGADDSQGIVEVYARDSPGDLNSSWTKVAEIPGNGGWFGGTLAIDGDTLVIGAKSNNAKDGAAYVYRRELPGDPTSGWSLVVKLTSGSQGQFGVSVAIDGDIIAIGAWASDFVADDAGSVHVLRATHGDLTSGWTEVHRLTASDGAAYDYFGSSVSIDGDTMVIGAAYRNYREGVSYVFTRETPGDLGSEWIEVARLDPPAGSGQKHHFGYSVSIDADTIAIGAAGYGFASGSGYVFVRDTPGNLSSGWSQVARLHPLVNNEPVTDIFESRSISLERDAILFRTTLGTAFLFTRDTPGDLNSAWRQNTEITYDNPWYPLTSSNFGWVVSISGENSRSCWAGTRYRLSWFRLRFFA